MPSTFNHTTQRARYYVRAIKRGGQVLGYGVYDCIGGMESQHVAFQTPAYHADVALHLANAWRDDANAGVA